MTPTADAGPLAVYVLSPPQAQEQPDQQKHKQQRRSPPDPQQLQALWRHFVEGACLSSSHERKALALQLLQLLLPVMGPDMVPVLLSKQLLGCVATALKDKASYLHASAKRCVVSATCNCAVASQLRSPQDWLSASRLLHDRQQMHLQDACSLSRMPFAQQEGC